MSFEAHLQSVDEILYCDFLNKSYVVILSCVTVYHTLEGGSNFRSMDEILKCDHLGESC